MDRIERVLGNPSLLEEIFSRIVDIKDRRNFRLVCYDWMRETLLYWRKTSQLHLCAGREPGTSHFFKNIMETTKYDHKPLMNVWKKEFHFEAIKLTGGMIQLPPIETIMERLQDMQIHPYVHIPKPILFLDRVGKSIKRLTLVNCPVFEDFFKGVKFILDISPNLDHLSIEFRGRRLLNEVNMITRNGNDDRENAVVATNLTSLKLSIFETDPWVHRFIRADFMNLVKLIPKLKSLDLAGSGLELLDAVRYSILDGISGITLQQLILNIEQKNWIDLSIFMVTVHPKLETLSITAKHPNIHFYTILKECSATVKKLTVVLTHYNNPGYISDFCWHNFPELTHLFLKISRPFQDFTRMIRFDFRAWSKLPKLEVFCCIAEDPIANVHGRSFMDIMILYNLGRREEELELEDSDEEDDDDEDDEEDGDEDDDDNEDGDDGKKEEAPKPSGTVKEFYFLLSNELDDECLRHINGWMPSLKHLALACTNRNNLYFILRIWKLKSLIIRCEEDQKERFARTIKEEGVEGHVYSDDNDFLLKVAERLNRNR